MTTRRWLSTLLALVAILLALAGCRNDKAGSGNDSGEAKALLEKSFANKDLKSGVLKLEAGARLKGRQFQGPLSVSLQGPFASRGAKRLPLLDWDLEVRGAAQDLTGGVTVTEDNAFVAFRGRAYEVGEKMFGELLRQARKGQKFGGLRSLKSLDVNPADWLENPEVAAGPDVGGDATRKVTGSLDVKKMLNDLIEVWRSPAVRKQLESRRRSLPKVPEVSDEELEKVADAVKEPLFEADVDERDVIRRLDFSAGFDVPEGWDEKGVKGVKGGNLHFSFELPEVGGEPKIVPPSDPRPLPRLLQQFGLDPTVPGGRGPMLQ